jgi:tRNA dimethylallyltransferase
MQSGTPLINLNEASTKAIVLEPDRGQLAEKIEFRFQQMAAQGGIEEVQTLMARHLSPQLPIMKAIGVTEIGSYLAGTIDLPHAIELASIASRQYAKRQRTWFRGQMDERWLRFESISAAMNVF